MQWLQNGSLQSVWEERVFIGRLKAPDEGLESFLLTERPVEEAEGAIGNWEGTRSVDGTIEGELDTFDEMESDCVFEATGGQKSQLYERLYGTNGTYIS